MPEGQEKQAQEVAVKRMRAFEVGVAHLCQQGGFGYGDLAKAAGQTEQTLGPALAEQLIAAGEKQQGQAQE